MMTKTEGKMRVAWGDIPQEFRKTAGWMYDARVDYEDVYASLKDCKKQMNEFATDLFSQLQTHFGEEVTLGIEDEGSFAFIYPSGRTSLNKATLKMNLITMGGLDPKVVDQILAKSSKLGAAGDPYVKFTAAKERAG